MKLKDKQLENLNWIVKDLKVRRQETLAKKLIAVIEEACDSRIMELLDNTIQYWYDLYINEWTEWCGAFNITNLEDFYKIVADDVYICDICGCELYKDFDNGTFDKEKDCLGLLAEYFGEYPLNIVEIIQRMFHAIFENKW